MTEGEFGVRNLYLKLKGGIFDFKGESMEPTLKEGCKVVVKPIDSDKIKRGNIIVFGREILACHRILSAFKKGNVRYFLERGDNSGLPCLISEHEIIGQAVSIIEEDGNEKSLDPSVIRTNILLYSLDIIVLTYITVRDLLKRHSFFRNRLIFKRLGTAAWKFIGMMLKILARV